MTITRFQTGPRMSKIVIHNDTIYLAGVVAAETNAGVREQTVDVLQQIEKLLSTAGSDKTKILSAQIYLADIATFNEMNSVWDAWVSKEHAPARATVEARLAAPAYKIEIKVIAAK